MRTVEAAFINGDRLSTARKYAMHIAAIAQTELVRCRAQQDQLESDLRAREAALEQAQARYAKLRYLPAIAVLGFLGFWQPAFFVFFIAIFYLVVLNTQTKEIAQMEAAVAEVRGRAGAVKPRRTVERIGQVYYPVSVRPASGGSMFLDTTGSSPGVTFAFPQLPESAGDIREVAEDVGAIKDLPVLLSASGMPDPARNGSFQPVGEEATLLDSIDRLRLVLDRELNLTTMLPVLPSNDNTVQSLLRTKWSEERQAPSTLLSVSLSQDVAQSIRAVDSIAAEARAARELGDDSIENTLMRTAHRVEEMLLEFSQARERSFSEVLLPGLDAMSGPYDLPSTRRYCPKCHDLPSWHYKRLGFSPDEAADVPIENLSRLPDPNPALDLRHEIDDLRSQAAAIHEGEAESETRRATYASAIRRRSLSLAREVRNQVAGRFQASAPRSRNAVLRLSVRDEQWHCPVCAETFPEEEARLMSILKVEDDLMLPMWRHLWLEKLDERNRVLREKEAERRHNKESEMSEYREEARQFSEEVRPLRIKIDDAASAAQTASGKILALVEQFHALGLLGDVDVDRYQEFVQDSGGTPDHVLGLKRRVVADERHLEGESDRVHDLRPTEIDIAETHAQAWVRDGEKAIAPNAPKALREGAPA